MKPKTVLLGFAILALAGCGSSQPAYTAHYYETHKGALKRELARCKKADTLSGNAKKNCQTAARVNAAAALFGGGTNNPNLLP